MRDLTPKQFAELRDALARLIYPVEPEAHLERVRGRLRPVARGVPGRPVAPASPPVVDGPPDMG
jgi:hypothetical protein